MRLESRRRDCVNVSLGCVGVNESRAFHRMTSFVYGDVLSLVSHGRSPSTKWGRCHVLNVEMTEEEAGDREDDTI